MTKRRQSISAIKVAISSKIGSVLSEGQCCAVAPFYRAIDSGAGTLLPFFFTSLSWLSLKIDLIISNVGFSFKFYKLTQILQRWTYLSGSRAIVVTPSLMKLPHAQSCLKGIFRTLTVGKRRCSITIPTSLCSLSGRFVPQERASSYLVLEEFNSKSSTSFGFLIGVQGLTAAKKDWKRIYWQTLTSPCCDDKQSNKGWRNKISRLSK